MEMQEKVKIICFFLHFSLLNRTFADNIIKYEKDNSYNLWR